MRCRSKTKSMRVILRLIVGLTASLFVLGLSNVQNAEGFGWHKGGCGEAEPVTCGDVLEDGYFELTGNLTCTGQTAITISGPAKLNLKGYTLSGDSAEDCILITGDGARVWNGTVENCRTGILIVGDGARVWNGTVENCRDGIVIELLSERSTIIHVKSRENIRRGFRIRGDENLLFNCSAMNNGRQGIKIEGDDEVSDRANGNKIYLCKAYTNCRDGIEIEFGDDNWVFFNRAENNGNQATCIASGGTYRPWFYAGFDVLSGSENNKIKFNYACDNVGCDAEGCEEGFRNFWDEDVDGGGNCVSTNEWKYNTQCPNPDNSPIPECSPGP